MDELIAIDHETIPGLDEDPGMSGSTAQWAPVHRKNPETWRLIIRSPRRIVAYWSFLPLHERSYKDFKNGNTTDSQITTDTLDILSSPGHFKAHFSIMAIKSQYQNITTNRMLFDSVVDQLFYLAQMGLFVEEFCAIAYSTDGIRMCDRLGMTPLGPHPKSKKSRIFILRMLPPDDRLPFTWYPELFDLYKRYSADHLR